MTRRSMAMVAASIILALLLIGGSVVYAVVAGEEAPIVPIATIALLAVASVLFVYKTRKIRLKGVEKLGKDYIEGYEEICEHLEVSGLNRKALNEIRLDLIEMMENSSHADKSFEESFGNAQEFANELSKQYVSMSSSFAMTFTYSAMMMIFFILGSNAVLWAEDTSRSFFDVTTDPMMMIFFFVAAFILMPVTQNLIKKGIIAGVGLPVLGGITLVAAAEAMRKFMYSNDTVRFILDGEIKPVYSEAILIAYVLAFVSLLLLRQYLRKKAVIRNE